MKGEQRSVSELYVLPDNPRHGDIGAISESLQRFGQQKPIVVNSDGIILAGNHTYQAAIALGWETIWVVESELEGKEQTGFALADNRLSDLATYDYDVLLRQLDDQEDLVGTGYDLRDIDDLRLEVYPEAYSRKVQSPVYQPSGPEPAIAELYDETRTMELRSAIDSADLPDELKEFLYVAAQRHTVFRYERIADFYAHADVEVQRLMESSALVIVDYEQAIENGFVRLNQEIADAFAADYEG